jgi:hypothetical protein
VDAVGVPVLTPSVDIANARIQFRGGAVGQHHGQPRLARADAEDPLLSAVGVHQPGPGSGVGEFLRLRRGASLADIAAGLPARLEEIVERIELVGDGRSRCAWSWSPLSPRCGASRRWSAAPTGGARWRSRWTSYNESSMSLIRTRRDRLKEGPVGRRPPPSPFRLVLLLVLVAGLIWYLGRFA